MNPIPNKDRKLFDTDPYYKKSCLSGKLPTKLDPIRIHHPWCYAGRQINEPWNYCPLLESEHSLYSKTPSAHNSKEISDRVKLIALSRTSLPELRIKYPKKNWEMEIRNINYNLQKYANEQSRPGATQ